MFSDVVVFLNSIMCWNSNILCFIDSVFWVSSVSAGTFSLFCHGVLRDTFKPTRS